MLPINITYKTVPRTASVPEYAARAFQVKLKDSSNIEAAFDRGIGEWEIIVITQNKTNKLCKTNRPNI